MDLQTIGAALRGSQKTQGWSRVWIHRQRLGHWEEYSSTNDLPIFWSRLHDGRTKKGPPLQNNLQVHFCCSLLCVSAILQFRWKNNLKMLALKDPFTGAGALADQIWDGMLKHFQSLPTGAVFRV